MFESSTGPIGSRDEEMAQLGPLDPDLVPAEGSFEGSDEIVGDAYAVPVGFEVGDGQVGCKVTGVEEAQEQLSHRGEMHTGRPGRGVCVCRRCRRGWWCAGWLAGPRNARGVRLALRASSRARCAPGRGCSSSQTADTGGCWAGVALAPRDTVHCPTSG